MRLGTRRFSGYSERWGSFKCASNIWCWAISLLACQFLPKLRPARSKEQSVSEIGWAPSVVSLTYQTSPIWHLIGENGVRCKRQIAYLMQEIRSEIPAGARKCQRCVMYEAAGREARRGA